jgi:3'-phosphoadenosine 5'-phosphosulfate (PAPS) 3'-phosphatase
LTNVTYRAELEVAIAAARRAGDAIRDLYDRAAAETYVKSDGSPVTDADLAADGIIRAAIGEAFPNDALLTEEGADDDDRLGVRRVWIVDPIDGTQQFVERTGEFDVLIAFVVDGEPVVGVALQPTTGLWLAAEAGEGAWLGQGDERRPYRFEAADSSRPPRLSTSIWFKPEAAKPGLIKAAARLGCAEPAVSSCGVIVRAFVPPDRPCDAYIALPTIPGQTMASEWDFAASDIITREAGGCFTDAWGRRFVYNKRNPRNIGGLVLSVDPVTHERVLAAIRPELPAS